MLKDLLTKNREIYQHISLLGRLSLNMVIPLLFFFLISHRLDQFFQTGRVFLIIGTLLGIFSGVYLNYRFLKRYFE